MSHLDFGGHPILHQYRYLLTQQEQSERLGRREYRRWLQEQQHHDQDLFSISRLLHRPGIQFIRWSRSLERSASLSNHSSL